MNNNRRKQIKNIEQEVLYCLKNEIYNILLFSNIKENILTVLIEEEEAYENYPENLQNSFRGEAMQDTIEYLEESIQNLEDIIENINKEESNILENIEECLDNLLNARLS